MTANATPTIDVYFETGKKRCFAGAIDWPGWCRSGKDEQSALQALLDYGARYARPVRAAGLDFQAPAGIASFGVTERLEGDATTDFGAPNKVPSADARPVEADELRRLQTLMEACWAELDRMVKAATGKVLRKGPRGGGRELDEIVSHVLRAEKAYLARIGRKLDPVGSRDPVQFRQAVLEALAAAAKPGAPAFGPRGGKLWSPRTFVRRAAWHILDHAWEIEDRIQSA